MADDRPVQSYANHRRYYPLFHFVTIPILVLNVIARIVFAWKHWPARMPLWDVVVAAILVALAFTLRIMILTVQNRVIRLEERLRLMNLLPEEMRGRVGELSTSQLIAMRFCSDDEVPELARCILAGEVKGNDEIKRRVKNWRADWLRA